MSKTNVELHEIIREYGLTRREAADLMMTTKPTVDRYLSPARKGRCANPTYRDMPAFRLQLMLDGLRRAGKKKVNP